MWHCKIYFHSTQIFNMSRCRSSQTIQWMLLFVFSIFGCICATCSCQRWCQMPTILFSTVCLSTTNLVNGPFVALKETVHFPSRVQFFDLFFPSHGLCRKLKNRSTRQKVFPLPTVGATSASNSPSSQRAGASGPRGLENNILRRCWYTFLHIS